MVKKDPALAVEKGEDDGGQRDHRRGREILRHQRPAEFAQDQRQRLRTVGKARVGHGPHRGDRDRDVDHDAGRHRSDDADDQVAPWVARLLRRGGDGVEAVKGEEDDCRRRHDAALDPVGAQALHEAKRVERFEMGGVEGRQREDHEDDQRGDLHQHQRRVDRGALPRAAQEQHGDDDDDRDRGEVDDPARIRPLHQRPGEPE
ncbi:hypothetical protein M2440_004361 [Methylorubrum extorquens]|nr:hypothetical protein [Methylorubrum extorquens]